MFILVDANSFFCHCEKLFRPDLANREVVVLSNNDGCVVSATRKVKQELGIKTGQPFFEIKEQCRKNNVATFSSNFSLYTKISKRMSDILKRYSNHVEVYSIDESFIMLPNYTNLDWKEFGKEIKDEVERILGMPVSVGIAKTKALSKICNHIAKKGSGVCYFSSDEEMDNLFSNLSVKEIWGIGKASANKLRMYGIKTVLDFKNYKNQNNIKKIITKVGLQVHQELNGEICFSLNENPKARKSIMCSRTFSKAVYDLKDLERKVASFITNAALKLRNEKGKTSCIEIFLIKKTYQNDLEPTDRISNFVSKKIKVELATNNTFSLIRISLALLKEIFENASSYKKAGVILSNISHETLQLSLFEQENEKEKKITNVVDQINARLGRDLVYSAACLGEKEEFYKQDYCSPRYLTSWDDLPVAG